MKNQTIFTIDSLREDIDLEAKRAGGRDGKGALPNDIWETYSSFSNTDGGVILLGVAEDSNGELSVSGIERVDQVISDLWNQLNNPQKVSRNLLTATSIKKQPTADGRWVIEIHIPRASRFDCPVFINGNPLIGTYKRQHAGDYRCREDEIRRMFAEQSEDSRDAKPLTGFTPEDLDLASLRTYRNRLAAVKPDHPFIGTEDLEFLRNIGGWCHDRSTDKEGLTLAGLLMFGKQLSIQEIAPNYFVDYRELPTTNTTTEWTDRFTPDGTWSGNLFDFYTSVIRRLFRDLKVPFCLVGDSRQDETPVHKALREALVNAIVHADYAARSPLLVIKAPGLFSFCNPGRMRICVNDALQGGHSDCRNRNLQKMFSLIGLGEQAGSGIPRVLENWKSQHYRPPELAESAEPEFTIMRLRTVSLLPEATLTELRRDFGKAFGQLDENSRLALATAHIEGFVSNRRLRQISRLHPRDITFLLGALVDTEMLVKDGQGRGTTYRLSGVPVVDLAVRSEDSGSKSIDSGSKSIDSGSKSIDSGSESPVQLPAPDPKLLELARPVREKSRVREEVIRSTILSLCAGRFLTVAEIAALLNRSFVDLRHRFIKPMFESGALERRFPHQPNHVKQAYRAVEEENE